MEKIEEYLSSIKTLIILDSHIVHWSVLREEIYEKKGFYRYRLKLKDESFIEAFEYFIIIENEIRTVKYSFHWQDKSGKLIKRWDNAPHHPEIETFPHHLHLNDEKNVQPHQPINLIKLIESFTENFIN